MSVAEKLATIAENEQKVYEAGKKSQYDEFWDALQIKGTRTGYTEMFRGEFWDDVSFKPKYDMLPSVASLMFCDSKITDLKAILERQGVVLDFSKCTNIHHVFQFSSVTKVGVLDCTSNTNTNTVIGENYSITDIDKIVLKDDGTQPTGDGWFWGGFALQNVIIEGKIGQSCHFSQSSKLTYESLMSIINSLYDYSGTSETRTLTLHASAKAKLSESDIATATQKGWTIT